MGDRPPHRGLTRSGTRSDRASRVRERARPAAEGKAETTLRLGAHRGKNTVVATATLRHGVQVKQNPLTFTAEGVTQVHPHVTGKGRFGLQSGGGFPYYTPQEIVQEL